MNTPKDKLTQLLNGYQKLYKSPSKYFIYECIYNLLERKKYFFIKEINHERITVRSTMLRNYIGHLKHINILESCTSVNRILIYFYADEDKDYIKSIAPKKIDIRKQKRISLLSLFDRYDKAIKKETKEIYYKQIQLLSYEINRLGDVEEDYKKMIAGKKK